MRAYGRLQGGMAWRISTTLFSLPPLGYAILFLGRSVRKEIALKILPLSFLYSAAKIKLHNVSVLFDGE